MLWAQIKRYVSTNGKKNGLFSPSEKISNSKASGKNISTQLFWKRCLKRNCKCTNPGTQDRIRSQCILFCEHYFNILWCFKVYQLQYLWNLDHGFDTQYTVKSMHLFPHRSHCRLSMIVRECTAPYRIDRRLSMVTFRDWIQHLFSHTRQTP